MSDCLNELRRTRVLAIIRTETAESAVRCVEALVEGGLTVVEISLTVPGGMKALEKAADLLGDRMVLGAGTVLDAATARACILAGVQFLVSPSVCRPVIETAKRYSKLVCPGALSPSEVIAAHEAGADAVKIFPCACVGGAAYIRALKGPFPQIELVPTGGITIPTCGEYLKAGAMAVGVGGAELMPPDDVRAGRYEVVRQRARHLAAAIQGEVK
jgi:2-dehydro-3-deoxyphosphogluconate aldolase / (4S)-4-hydroxy-2-oxoglutarate aldolase